MYAYAVVEARAYFRQSRGAIRNGTISLGKGIVSQKNGLPKR